MTREEAIKAIEDNRPKSGYVMLNEALDMAITALQNQMVWIPVTEAMPEEHEPFNEALKRYYKKTSGRLLVTVEEADGQRGVMKGRTEDGKWKTEFSLGNVNVVAWMPFPEPYQESEVEE